MDERGAPEPPGVLDFPISPAMGSTGPFVPAGAAMIGLTLVALACMPLMCPLDVALLSMQSLVLVLSWLVCDAQQESAEARLGATRGKIEAGQVVGSAVAEASLLLEGREFPVREVALIGRAEDCHIRLDEDGVGAYHVAVVAGRGRVAVVDLLAGGMFVNGVELSEGQLEAGDTVRVGRSSFLCYLDGSGAAEPGPVGALGGPSGVVRLAPGSCTWIGSASECDIVVDDPGVADRHALVAVGAGGTATLIDFTSASGTRVNAARAHFRVLADGDILTVGQTSLTFHERV